MTTEKGSMPDLGAVFAFGLLFGFAACEMDEAPPMEETTVEEVEDMPMDRMEVEPEMAERHAEEVEEMAAEVRTHITRFRARPPVEQHARVSEHVFVVERMVGLMDRQMQELQLHAPLDESELAAMMGMSLKEHRALLEGMAALRSEAEDLEEASLEELGERMPTHLDRLEAMVTTLEDTVGGSNRR